MSVVSKVVKFLGALAKPREMFVPAPTTGSASRPSPHFDWDDVSCNDRYNSMPPPELMENVMAVAQLMEAIRSYLGDKPITVNSWYRTKAYNTAVGGSAKSNHMLGRAVDFRVKGMTPAEVFVRLWTARNQGHLPIGGLAGYPPKNGGPGFVHVDIDAVRSWKTGLPANDAKVGKR